MFLLSNLIGADVGVPTWLPKWHLLQSITHPISNDSKNVPIVAAGQVFNWEHDGEVHVWTNTSSGLAMVTSNPICIIEVKYFPYSYYFFQCKRENHNKESMNILAQEAAELLGLAIQNFLSSEPSIVPSDEVLNWISFSRLVVIGLFIVLSSLNNAHCFCNCSGTIHTTVMAGWITRGSLFNCQTKSEIQSCIARRKAFRSTWSVGSDVVFGRVFRQDHRVMKAMLETI